MQGISTNCKKITEKYQKNIKHETQKILSNIFRARSSVVLNFSSFTIFSHDKTDDSSPLTAKKIHK